MRRMSRAGGAALHPCRLSTATFGRRQAAGPDRRPVRHRERRARSPHGARHPRDRRADSSSKHRSIKPTAPASTPIAARACARACAFSPGVKARGLPDPHRYSRARAGRSRGRSRGHSADPGVPLPPDRPAGRRRPHRPDRQHQEGPVRGAARYPPRGGESGVARATRRWC